MVGSATSDNARLSEAASDEPGGVSERCDEAAGLRHDAAATTDPSPQAAQIGEKVAGTVDDPATAHHPVSVPPLP